MLDDVNDSNSHSTYTYSQQNKIDWLGLTALSAQIGYIVPLESILQLKSEIKVAFLEYIKYIK